MAYVQQLPSGSWRIQVYTGKDPLTGDKLYEKRTVKVDELKRIYPGVAPAKAAKLEANRWELELRDGELTGEGGTFRKLCTEYMKIGERTMSPKTHRETQGMIDRYLDKPLGDLDADRIRTRTLDTLYGELAARGGRCQHRPCPRTPCPEGRRRCQRKTCKHPPCEAHQGACADWVPCVSSPCPHGSPLSIATVARVHGVIQAVLQLGVKWGWLRRNYAELANPGTVVEDEVDPPGEADVILILADCDRFDPMLADYCAVAIDAGPRRGANHATRWSYISDDYTRIRFPCVIVPKKGQGRGHRNPAENLVDRPAAGTKRTARQWVTLSPYTAARLRARHTRAKERALSAGVTLPDDAYVWTDDPQGAVPWHPDSTTRKFRHAVGSNFDETRLHDLRHAMASILLAAGIDPKAAAARGGWVMVATMLNRYTHVLPTADKAAAEVMGRVLGAQATSG